MPAVRQLLQMLFLRCVISLENYDKYFILFDIMRKIWKVDHFGTSEVNALCFGVVL